MSQLNLIINALQNCSKFQPKNYYEIDKALAAALELRDQKPEWQELYKDEIKQILNDGEEWSSLEFAQAVSDLLREKNT
jgi:hypothetical protein